MHRQRHIRYHDYQIDRQCRHRAVLSRPSSLITVVTIHHGPSRHHQSSSLTSSIIRLLMKTPAMRHAWELDAARVASVGTAANTPTVAAGVVHGHAACTATRVRCRGGLRVKWRRQRAYSVGGVGERRWWRWRRRWRRHRRMPAVCKRRPTLRHRGRGGGHRCSRRWQRHYGRHGSGRRGGFPRPIEHVHHAHVLRLPTFVVLLRAHTRPHEHVRVSHVKRSGAWVGSVKGRACHWWAHV